MVFGIKSQTSDNVYAYDYRLRYNSYGFKHVYICIRLSKTHCVKAYAIIQLAKYIYMYII